MLNLLKMDFGIYKYSFIFMFIYAVFFPAMFDSFAIVGTIAFLCIYMIIISAFSADEKDQIDLLHKSLPVTSREIIGTKYLEAVIVWFVSVILSILAIKGIGYIKEYNNMPFYMFHDVRDVTFTLTTVFASAMIMVSVMLPIMYKFGIGKGRFILNIIWFAAAFSFPAIFAIAGGRADNFAYGAICGAMLIAAAAATAISFFISVRIYEKR